jgi:hypothetical protein
VRLIVAIVLLAVSTLTLSIGIAQRTVFDAPDTVEVSVSTGTRAPAIIIHGTELLKYPGRQTITVEGGTSGLVRVDGGEQFESRSTDRVFLAYGRTIDVMAWISPARHISLGVDALSAELSALPRSGELYLPDPAGSDLWFAEYDEVGSASISIAAPEDVTVLIMSDGTLPAPNDISVSWPIVNEAPWILALIVVGLVSMVGGFVALFISWSYWRKTRGPRRRTTRRPKVRAPRAPRVKRPSSVQPRGRRAARFVAIPVVVVLGLGACTAVDPEPVDEELEPVSTQVVAPYPAVTELQFSKIMTRVADQIRLADEEFAINALGDRVEEPTLSARRSAYIIKRADAESGTLVPIPASPIRLVVPQQTTTWPRSVFGIIQDEADLESPSLGVVLKQVDPRSPYELTYAIVLNPQVQLPDLPAANLGAPKLSADSKLTRVPPAELVARYADVLRLGSQSEFAREFALANDPLYAQAGPEAEALRQESFGETVEVTWESSPGDSEVVAFSTADSGALVMGTIIERELVVPLQSGAAVNSSVAVRALTSLSQSTQGFDVESQLQILWYVPPVGSQDAIRVLGFTYSLIGAKEAGRE